MKSVHAQTILSRRHSAKRKFSQNKGFPTVQGFTLISAKSSKFQKSIDAQTKVELKIPQLAPQLVLGLRVQSQLKVTLLMNLFSSSTILAKLAKLTI